jgi:ElaB/YqjD/DUF883 family membrane-anchored ribosome-binding protein
MKNDPNQANPAGNASEAGTRRGGTPATDTVADAAHSAVERAADSVAKAEERMREKAATAERQLREKTAEARASGEQLIDHVRQYTQEKPLAAAAIAFAAGMVVSRMLSR